MAHRYVCLIAVLLAVIDANEDSPLRVIKNKDGSVDIQGKLKYYTQNLLHRLVRADII